jgi:probable rRNA maturation factor
VKLHVDIQNACTDPVPDEDDIRSWIAATIEGRRLEAEVSVRLVNEMEMRKLNHDYRGQDKPTNVLSFPADLPPELQHPLLGDIVICAPVVRDEAQAQHKATTAHWAHMLIHGSLHLLGYDHIEPAEADAMEALETAILQALSFPCPYGGETAIEGIRSMA